MFRPSVSLWNRIFGRSTGTHSPLPNAVDIEDWDMKLPPPSLLPLERSHSKKDRSLMLDSFSDFKPPVSALRQPRKKGFVLSHIGRPHGRKVQFSPQESDFATLVDDDEAPAKVSSPSVEIGTTWPHSAYEPYTDHSNTNFRGKCAVDRSTVNVTS